MAIAFVQSKTTDSGSGFASTVTVAPTNASSAGDTYWVGWGQGGNGTVTEAASNPLTDSKGNTYVEIDKDNSALSSVGYTAQHYIADNIASASAGTNTITGTFSASASFRWMTVIEFSGCATSALDGHAKANGNSASASVSVTATSGATTDVAIGMTIWDSGGETVGSGFTSAGDATSAAVISEYKLNAGTPISITSTGTSGLWLIFGALFKAPSSAVGLDDGGLPPFPDITFESPPFPLFNAPEEPSTGAKILGEDPGPFFWVQPVDFLAPFFATGEEFGGSLPIEEQNAPPAIAADAAPPPLQAAEDFPGGPFPFEEPSPLPQVASDAPLLAPLSAEEFPPPTVVSAGLEDLPAAFSAPLEVFAQPLLQAAEDFPGAPLHIDDPAPLPPAVDASPAPNPPQWAEEFPPPVVAAAGLEELPAALSAPIEPSPSPLPLGVEELVSLPLEEQGGPAAPVTAEWAARLPVGDQETTSPVLLEDTAALAAAPLEQLSAAVGVGEDAALPIALDETGAPLPAIPPEAVWVALLTMPAEELPGHPYATDDGAGLLWWVPFDPQYSRVPIGADEQILIVQIGPMRVLLADAPIIGVTTADAAVIQVTTSSYP